jgi:hypothetical protein
MHAFFAHSKITIGPFESITDGGTIDVLDPNERTIGNNQLSFGRSRSVSMGALNDDPNGLLFSYSIF